MSPPGARGRGRSSVAPLSVGVIGAGQIAVDLHLPTLLAMEDVRVAWVADARAERAAAVARAFGVPALSPPGGAAALPETDVLLLAIPYGARARFYDTLRGRRTALYVEKPFARTEREHREILSARDGAAVACGFQRRSTGVVRCLRDVLAANLFGPLRAMRIEHGHTGILTGSAYSSQLDLAGGGILLEVGIHALDAGLFAMAATEARVVAGRMIRDLGFDVHTRARLEVTAGDGGIVPVDLVVSGLRDTQNGIECVFDAARVFLPRSGDDIVVRPVGAGSAFRLAASARAGPRAPHEVCHEHWTGFLESIRTGRPNWTSASQTLLTTRVIEGLYDLPESEETRA